MSYTFIEEYRKGTRKCALQSCCDLAYAVAKLAILRHMDRVPHVQNHVTFQTHFNGSISPLFYYILKTKTLLTEFVGY